MNPGSHARKGTSLLSPLNRPRDSSLGEQTKAISGLTGSQSSLKSVILQNGSSVTSSDRKTMELERPEKSGSAVSSLMKV